jgi:transposase InsO family protein
LVEIRTIYEDVGGIYGYRRILLTLNRKLDKKLNHKRIYRLMRLMGLKSVIRIKRKSYVKSTPQHIAENLLNRDFTAEGSNEKWLTDVTEFKYGNGEKAYLSAILDVFDKNIIAYVLGHSNNNSLVFTTLEKAMQAVPGARPMLHSDRGFQYTSLKFRDMLGAAGITQSMSRVGRCIDNGPMECFWGLLKSEKYYLNKYQTYEQIQAAIDEYIDFYNTKRYQKRLNGLSPLEFRALAA